MKKVIIASFYLLLLAGTVHAQRVGIGTETPVSRLSIDSGLNIDQANLNGVLLESALTFGNNKKVGIGSRRTAGTNQAGLDFYTQGARRMVIDSFGNVGIGTTTPDRRLHVEGTVYGASYIIAAFGISAGIGNVIPSYDLHTTVGYFTTRVGIGTVPNSTYALDIDGGPVRMRQDARIDGILNPNNPLLIGNNTTIEGSLLVQGTKGIVRSHNATQVKTVRTSVELSATNLPAGGSVDSGVFPFETFGGTPQVYVGNLVSSTNNEWDRVQFVPFNVTATGCQFRVTNQSTTAVTTVARYALLIIGPE